MEKYKIQKTVGSGSFANVSKALNTKTNEIVAIKKMKKKFSSWDECLNLREIKSLTKLNHPNLMKLKEVIRVNDELFCVFEFCDQNIYQYYLSYKESGQSIPEHQIKQILYQTIAGLAYMHKHGFFHRDLKPENVLYSKGVIKIGDFGLAREIRSRPPYTDYVATRWYRAPEILLKSTNYNSPVDIYAVGCIIAELYLLNPLFSGSSEMDQIHKICSLLGTPSQNAWSEGYRLASQIGFNFPHYQPIPLGNILVNASPEAVHLIAGMLSFDPAKRPTAMQILSHPYLNGIAPLFPGISGITNVNNSCVNIDKKVTNNINAVGNQNNNNNAQNNNNNTYNNNNNYNDSSSEEEELILTRKDPFKKNINNNSEEVKLDERMESNINIQNKEVWRGENEVNFISEEKKKILINEPKLLTYSSTNLEHNNPSKLFLIKDKEPNNDKKNFPSYDEEIRLESENNNLNTFNNLNNLHSYNNNNNKSSSSIKANDENNENDFEDDEDEIKLESQPVYIPSIYAKNPQKNNNTINKPMNLDNIIYHNKDRNRSVEKKEKNLNNNNKNSSIGRENYKDNKEKAFNNENNTNMFLPKLKPNNAIFSEENNNKINKNLPLFDNNNNSKMKNANYNKEKAMKLPNLTQNGGLSNNKNTKFMNSNNNNINMPSLISKNNIFSPGKNLSKDEEFIGKYKL